MPPFASSPSRRWRSVALRSAVVLALACLFVLGTALMDGGVGIVPAALVKGPAWDPWSAVLWRMICNALPGLLLALSLLALTRRALLSFALAFAAEALLYAGNALKVQNLGTPLIPADFRMAGQLEGGGGELLSGYLPHSPWPYLVIVAALLALAALVRYEPPVLARGHWRGRGVAGAVGLLALASLLAGLSIWTTVYDKGRLGMQPWSASATARHTGEISSLMLFHLQFGAASSKPDKQAALEMMARYDRDVRQRMQAPATGTPQKPDIVVILSESFFDPTILNGYAPDADFMPNLHRLAQHGTSGWLHVPTFGGGTIRTEFEVLTGLPLRYFPQIQFPYLQINTRTIPGIVRDLRNDGYETLAVHGNDPAFWNRASAFRKLGFEHFVSQADFPPDDSVHDGKYMSDKSFTDELLRQLKPDGPPRFVLGISIEAHGPYDQDYGIDLTERDAIPVPPAVTGEPKRELQNYIYHIRHADQQLGRLVDTLAQRDRPTLVLFFGDHLPAIVPAFQAAGFHNGKGFLLQSVPYLLVDTTDVRTAAPERHDAAAWELPGMVLGKAGLHIDPWFALTQAVAPQLAGLTRAPDAPPPSEDGQQKQLDTGMSNASRLRLEGKLDALWPQAAAMATQDGTDGGPAAQAPAGHAAN